MSKFSRILAGIGILVGVIVIGIFLGWLGSSRSHSGTSESEKQGSTVTENKAPAPAKARPTETSPVASAPVKPRTIPLPAQPVAPAVPVTNGIPDWEDRLDAILAADSTEDAAKAKQLLDMFPQLSPDAQEEVAHHLSNLTPDENYGPLGSYLTNSALPEAVLDVLLEDVLNRPNSIKLPMLLEMARDPQHPKSSESKDVIELFLEEDFGTDWARWQSKMEEWLKENPD